MNECKKANDSANDFGLPVGMPLSLDYLNLLLSN